MEDPMNGAEGAQTASFPRYRTVHAPGELFANVLLIDA
jgi:hypothetical protein